MDRVGGQRRCIFIEGRPCPFQGDQMPLQTCQVCVEAWKTDLAIRARSGDPSAEAQQAFALGGERLADSASLQAMLNELDELFVGDRIDPIEYIRLRKEQVDRLMDGKEPSLSLGSLGDASPPEPRETRVMVVVKSLLGNRVYTRPEGWVRPAAISDRVVDSVFRLAETMPAEKIRVGVGGYKIACIRHAKGKMALLVLDHDEEFEAYSGEIARLRDFFEKYKEWVKSLREAG